MKIKIDDGAFIPERAHDTDAGYDLRAPVCVRVPAHGSAFINTGVHIELPHGKCAILISKSGLNVKHDLTNTGLIDEGYTGAIHVKVYNHGKVPYVFSRGDKIGQFVITNYFAEDFEISNDFTESERGSNGFGSTGK